MILNVARKQIECRRIYVVHVFAITYIHIVEVRSTRRVSGRIESKFKHIAFMQLSNLLIILLNSES